MLCRAYPEVRPPNTSHALWRSCPEDAATHLTEAMRVFTDFGAIAACGVLEAGRTV